MKTPKKSDYKLSDDPRQQAAFDTLMVYVGGLEANTYGAAEHAAFTQIMNALIAVQGWADPVVEISALRSRSDNVPAMCAEVEAMRAEIAALREALAALINGEVRISSHRNDMLSEHDPKVINARKILGNGGDK